MKKQDMPDDTTATMFMCTGLLPEEEAALKLFESPILEALLARSIYARPWWTSTTQLSGRVVQLVLPDQPEPRVLIQLDADEISSLTQDDLISRLNQNIT